MAGLSLGYSKMFDENVIKTKTNKKEVKVFISEK
jgi:hypothetical protein